MITTFIATAILSVSAIAGVPAVEFEPVAPVQEACVYPVFPEQLKLVGVEVQKENRQEGVTFRINVPNTYCEEQPVNLAYFEIKGGYSNPWPQELVAVTKLPLKEAGVYTVTWDHPACGSFQSDIIYGNNIPEILENGWGHDNLLAGLDNSAHQHFGEACPPVTTTTTAPPETTTTAPVTTSTAPEATTTTIVTTSTTEAAQATTAAPSTTTPTSLDTARVVRYDEEQLAYTGVGSQVMIAGGVALIILGAFFRKVSLSS